MKKLLLLIALLFGLNCLFAHIDRPIDALIFEGKTYEIYSVPLNSYIKNDRLKKRVLLTNPVNPRIPKHYYATFEIKDNKLYLNKIDLIIVKEKDMRFWRFPLALNYSYKPVEAKALFGKGAEYPILCDWYTGELFGNIFDGDRDRTLLFAENTIFNIKDGEFLGESTFETRSLLTNVISIKEFPLIYKSFADKSFGLSEMLFDLRLLTKPQFLSNAEFERISRGEIFKTRGYLHIDEKKRLYVHVPKTRKTQAQTLSFFGHPKHDISDFKEGDRVEVTGYFLMGSYSRAGILSLSHLEDDELIHDPAFFMRIN